MTKKILSPTEIEARNDQIEAWFVALAVTGIFIAGMVALIAGASGGGARPEPQLPQVQEFYIPPCEFEDSTNCFWDAEVSGNSEGVSFVDIGGTAYYPESAFEDVKN